MLHTGGSRRDGGAKHEPGRVRMHDAAILRQKLAAVDDNVADPKATAKKLAMLKEIVDVLIEEIEGLGHIQTLKANLHLGDPIDLPEELRKFETHFIRSALERTGGHQTHAARLLGI